MRPWGVKRLFGFSSRTPAEVRKDIADEVAFHVDMRAEELRRSGLTEAEARAQASRELDPHDPRIRGLAQIDDGAEQRRRGGQFLAELRRDAAIGLRLLRRSPGFAIVAILTLAIGIGANTAIYSVLDAVLLRPLPYPEPDRLVLVNETLDNGSPNNASGGAYLDWRAHETTFDALALAGQVRYNLRGAGAPERLAGLEVSHEFLRVLGVPPLLGRGFLPDEDRPGGRTDVVILAEQLWRTRFGADPAIIGRSIVLDEVPRTVVGVLPAGAWVFKDDLFFVPAVLVPGTPRAARSPHWAVVLGRLAPGVPTAEADAELKSIKRRLNREYPPFKQKWGVVVRPVEGVLGGVTRTPLLILLGAVSLVLLIACANVANLVLARSCQRQQELAVRAAIGASGWRLARQVLTENLVLALFGGAAGVAVAYAGVAVLNDLAARVAPITFTPRLDVRVLTFSLLVTLATGPLFGLLPALRARRPDLNAALTNGGRGATAGGHQRTQAILVAAEVALTVVLLASAGLLLRSLANAASVDPGFQPDRVLAFDVSLPDSSYTSREKRIAFASQLVARLRTLPGVDGAGTAMAIPFTDGGYGEFFNRPGQTDRDAVIGRMDFVSAGYLEALGTRLLGGRRITEADNAGAGQPVVVINETAARMFFPAASAVGQPMIIAGETWTVVGVIADVVDRRLDTASKAFGYAPMARNTSQLSVIVHTPLQPLTLVERARAEIARLDPGVALARPRSLETAMADSMLQRKAVLGLIGVFAVAALALASIGLYGVMAYAVASRGREFGIRIAFGASGADLIRQVVASGLRMIAVGLAVGLAAAAGVGRLLSSELFQVGASDPVVLSVTTAMVIAVAIAACLVPAWRATRVEPVAALRAE